MNKELLLRQQRKIILKNQKSEMQLWLLSGEFGRNYWSSNP